MNEIDHRAKALRLALEAILFGRMTKTEKDLYAALLMWEREQIQRRKAA